ncbi:hypothetical protein MUP77_03250 [Candidatus Bathyarchaeota archaeon]|nr:hypothetical protein [Candidatus Bathyarchaeota archaeon]
MKTILCSHGQFDDVYLYFSNLLKRDMLIKELPTSQVTYSEIADADIFVLMPANNNELNIDNEEDAHLSDKLKNIQRFVNKGGSVLLLGSALNDEDENSQINQLGRLFDLFFDNHFSNCSQKMSVIKPSTKHEIAEGVDTFSYPYGCAVRTNRLSFELMFSDEFVDSDKKEKKRLPVLVAFKCGKGKVVGIGSHLIFDSWHIDDFDNRRLITNIVEWLSM